MAGVNFSKAIKYASCCMLAAASFGAGAIADVQVEFSGFLSERMERISTIERAHEEYFREFRSEGRRRPSAVEQLRQNRFAGGEWGIERLFPDVASYSVPALFKAQMENGIKAADPSFGGTVIVRVNKMRVKEFSLAPIRSHRSQVSGTVTVRDAGGNIVATHDISVSLRPDYTLSKSYKGPDYAYLAEGSDMRVGPIVSEFTEKVLETLYPNYDAPGAILVRE